MSRWEFMRQLEELLSDIAPTEREEALQYYNDYLNDAGRENEQDVIASLGTPEQVAQIVRDGLLDGDDHGTFTEQGFQSSEPIKNAIIKKEAEANTGEENTWAGSETVEKSGEKGGEKSGLPTWAIVLLVIGCIIFSPVIIGLFFSLMGILFGALCSVIGIVIGIGAATLALYIAAVALIIVGFGCLFASPLAGIGLIGAALICAALGILFMLLFYLLVAKCIPGICQGIAYIFKKIFGKKGGAKA